jgi:hypothetical protein
MSLEDIEEVLGPAMNTKWNPIHLLVHVDRLAQDSVFFDRWDEQVTLRFPNYEAQEAQFEREKLQFAVEQHRASLDRNPQH